MLNASWMQAIMYYVVALAAGAAGLWLFGKATSFDDWREIGRGNVAAALATGGQVLGLAHILHTAIAHNDTLLAVLGWAALGYLLQVGGYFLFEVATHWKSDHEVASGNVAVGAIIAIVTVALSHLVAAVIT